MPAGRVTTIEHDPLGIIGRETADEIAPGAREAFAPGLRAIAPEPEVKRDVAGASLDEIRHGTPP